MTWTAAERRAKTAERIAASRCVSCKRPVLPGEGKRCPKCERVAARARRQWTKSEAGQAWNREYAAARYADRKARGVCIRCETPAAPGRISCAAHLAADKLKTQLWLAARDERQAVAS